MTVSAIFLFMTFRIDRGAKFEARSVARKIAKEATKKAKEVVTEVEKKIEETITEIKKEVEEKAIKAITEVEKEVKRKAAEAIDGIKNKVEKVDDDQNKIIERINQLTDESIHKQIDARLQNRDIDILESVIKKAKEEMRKQRARSDDNPRHGWDWLRRCWKWLRGYIRRNDEN